MAEVVDTPAVAEAAVADKYQKGLVLITSPFCFIEHIMIIILPIILRRSIIHSTFGVDR